MQRVRDAPATPNTSISIGKKLNPMIHNYIVYGQLEPRYVATHPTRETEMVTLGSLTARKIEVLEHVQRRERSWGWV